MSKDIQQEIKEHWFKDHVAILTQHGNMTVLDWRNPSDFSYHCRFVFDRQFVYISGDIGDAVFRLTWSANIHSFDDIHIHYFREKLSGCSGVDTAFNSEKAVGGLREWLKDLKEEGTKYDHDEMRDLFADARSCSNKKEWDYMVNNRYDFINELDQGCFEWIYEIGDEIPARIHAYLIGLQMASEQLKSLEVEV